jgi:hypothetical protein
VEQSQEPRGRSIAYTYKREDGTGPPTRDGYDVGAQIYPKTISFGNYTGTGGVDRQAFQLLFDYGEHRLDDLGQSGNAPFDETLPWPRRSDMFSAFHAGFEVRSCRLVRTILALFHRLNSRLIPASFICGAPASTWKRKWSSRRMTFPAIGRSYERGCAVSSGRASFCWFQHMRAAPGS